MREQLLDDENCVLIGKTEAVKETEKSLKHKPLPCNTWRLVEYFELFMSCPKDELHQRYVVSTSTCMYLVYTKLHQQ